MMVRESGRSEMALQHLTSWADEIAGWSHRLGTILNGRDQPAARAGLHQQAAVDLMENVLLCRGAFV